MWVRVVLLLCLGSWLASARESSLADPLTVEEVRQILQQHLSQKKFNAAGWGIKVVALNSGAVIFQTNESKLLKPASTAKLFTAALALDFLGPEHRIRTSLFAKTRPGANGTLPGDLIVYGRGDPSFAARFQNGSYSNLLGRIVEAADRAGVKRIAGDLIGDETYFTGPRLGSSWTWEDLQYYYGAEVSALTFQDNVIDLVLRPSGGMGEPCRLELRPETAILPMVNRTRTTETNQPARITVYRPVGESRAYLSGSLPLNHRGWAGAVSVPNPARWFTETLRSELASRGIEVAGTVQVRSWPEHPDPSTAGLVELASVESPPLREIVAQMMKPSQNLYAQLLLLQAGANSSGGGTTEEAGLRELRSFARRAGIAPGEVLLDDGSGLSRAALVTPGAIARLLEFMARHKHGAAFRESLPGPGEGTLRNRLPELRGKLRAKTGSIRYVNCLAGYVTTRSGEDLGFAVMLNAYQNTSAVPARDDLEFVPRLLSKMK